MHGANGGAPAGNRNAFKHGDFTAEGLALKRQISALARLARKTMAAIESDGWQRQSVDARRSPKGPTRSVRPSKRRGSHNGGLPAASRTSRKTTSLKGRLCGVTGSKLPPRQLRRQRPQALRRCGAGRRGAARLDLDQPLAVVGGSDQSACRAAAEPADLNSKPKSVCDPRHRAHVNNLLIDQAG